MSTLFEAVGGETGLRALALAWHERVVVAPIVSHAFAHGSRDDHVERLAAYWAEALGGPPAYSSAYGSETDVVRLHSGNGEHDEMNVDAVECFAGALQDVGLDADPRLFRALLSYFTWATWESMYAFHGSADAMPEGVAIPRWSWDGPVP